MDLYVLGLVWYVVLLFSLTVHEAAHAWAAQRGGDPTAYHGGQVSLDPLPHIRREPFGTVVVPILSFVLGGWMIGWASTPYDPVWARAYPRRAAWMSLAGPAGNAALVLAAILVIRAGIAAGVFLPPLSVSFTRVVAAAAPGVAESAALVVSVLFTLNLVLLAFNLIPVPPLDGSGALSLVLPEAAAERWRALLGQPMLAIVGILIAWRIFPAIFGPLHGAAIRLLYPETNWG
jgi:Zn-dependent protease